LTDLGKLHVNAFKIKAFFGITKSDGQDLFDDIHEFMVKNKFTLLDSKRIAKCAAKDSFTDVIYIGPSLQKKGSDTAPC